MTIRGNCNIAEVNIIRGTHYCITCQYSVMNNLIHIGISVEILSTICLAAMRGRQIIKDEGWKLLEQTSQ
jgi:hypothetical protein